MQFIANFTIKTFFEKLRFSFLNVFSESSLKISWWGTCPQLQLPWLTRACGTLLTPSAIAYYAGIGQGKWALWQFCPTTEKSLKNALK
jgi:hypothetical protein